MRNFYSVPSISVFVNVHFYAAVTVIAVLILIDVYSRLR